METPLQSPPLGPTLLDPRRSPLVAALAPFSLLLTLTTPPAAAIPASFAAPSSNLVFQFGKQNQSHPWLKVTSESVRFTLKADRFERVGLVGLTSVEDPRPRDPLPWSRVARIDEVVTRARSFGMLGGITIGLLGAGLGNALGAPDGQGGAYALAGLTVMGAVGAFVGARFGERFQHERNWYVGEPLPAPNTVLASAESSMTVPEPSLPAPTASLRAARRIGPDDAVRVVHSDGHFQGFAQVAGPEGLEGLRIDPHAAGEWRHSALPERIPWESIDEIRMRGGSGLRGTLAGATVFGAVGALFGLAVVAALSDGNVNPAEGALAGFAITAPVGALIGAGAGAMFRRWVVVYQRP
jgi:hypothetical protein